MRCFDVRSANAWNGGVEAGEDSPKEDTAESTEVEEAEVEENPEAVDVTTENTEV